MPNTKTTTASTTTSTTSAPTIGPAYSTWTVQEHTNFLDGLKRYGRSWENISKHLIRTRTPDEIRAYATCYFDEQAKLTLPPPSLTAALKTATTGSGNARGGGGGGGGGGGSSTSNNSNNNKKVKEGHWTDEEHEFFLECWAKYGKSWKKISQVMKTRSNEQIRTHAQKYFTKLGQLRHCGYDGEYTMDGTRHLTKNFLKKADAEGRLKSATVWSTKRSTFDGPFRPLPPPGAGGKPKRRSNREGKAVTRLVGAGAGGGGKRLIRRDRRQQREEKEEEKGGGLVPRTFITRSGRVVVWGRPKQVVGEEGEEGEKEGEGDESVEGHMAEDHLNEHEEMEDRKQEAGGDDCAGVAAYGEEDGEEDDLMNYVGDETNHDPDLLHAHTHTHHHHTHAHDDDAHGLLHPVAMGDFDDTKQEGGHHNHHVTNNNNNGGTTNTTTPRGYMADVLNEFGMDPDGFLQQYQYWHGDLATAGGGAGGAGAVAGSSHNHGHHHHRDVDILGGGGGTSSSNSSNNSTISSTSSVSGSGSGSSNVDGTSTHGTADELMLMMSSADGSLLWESGASGTGHDGDEHGYHHHHQHHLHSEQSDRDNDDNSLTHPPSPSANHLSTCPAMMMMVATETAVQMATGAGTLDSDSGSSRNHDNNNNNNNNTDDGGDEDDCWPSFSPRSN